MLGSKAYVLLHPTVFSPFPVLLFVTDAFPGLCFFLSQRPLLPLGQFYPVILKSPTASSADINVITLLTSMLRTGMYDTCPSTFTAAKDYESHGGRAKEAQQAHLISALALHPTVHTETHLTILRNLSSNIFSVGTF